MTFFISGGKQCSLPLEFFLVSYMMNYLSAKRLKKSLNKSPYPWIGLYINLTWRMDQLNETDIFENLLWARHLISSTWGTEGKTSPSFLPRNNEDRNRSEGGQNLTKLPWYQSSKYYKLLVYTECSRNIEEELDILRKNRESFTKYVTREQKSEG